MANIIVRAPVEADIGALVQNLRAADRDELLASHGPDLHAAVAQALRVSGHQWAVEIDGALALLGGLAVTSLLGGIASPWLLGTDLLERHPGALTRLGRQYRDVSCGLYSVLFNYVDARNVKAQRWLRRLGFQIAGSPVPYGPKGLPFYRFEMRT